MGQAGGTQTQSQGPEVLKRFPLKCGAELCISAGDATKFGAGTEWAPGDIAVVNAANTMGLGGAGVDGMLNNAGGPALIKDREALPRFTNGDRIEEGGAVATGPNTYGSLPFSTVIHAVGPNYMFAQSEEACDGLLKSAYEASFRVAKERDIKYLGCCILSAGIFRGPKPLEEVQKFAVQGAIDYAYEGLREVHLLGYQPQEVQSLIRVATAIAGSAGAAS